MVTKTVHLTEDLLKSVSYRTKLEDVELSGVSLRRMLDILAEHGVKGNVRMDQQINALDYAKNL